METGLMRTWHYRYSVTTVSYFFALEYSNFVLTLRYHVHYINSNSFDDIGGIRGKENQLHQESCRCQYVDVGMLMTVAISREVVGDSFI